MLIQQLNSYCCYKKNNLLLFLKFSNLTLCRFPVILNNNNSVIIKRFYRNKIYQYLSSEFPAVVAQKEFESFWSNIWQESKLFENKQSQSNFKLLLPPPNITGHLHLGFFLF